MNDAQVFQYFWLAMVGVIGMSSLAWAVNDVRSGSARMHWGGARVRRDEEPFEFWMAVGSKTLGVVVAGFMLWFGSRIPFQ